MVASVVEENRRRFLVWARRAGILALAIALAYLIIAIWDRDAFGGWMPRVSPIAFFLAMAILPAFGAPQSPFLIIAGATYGVAVGLIGSLLAIALNLCICYAIAHSKLRPLLLRVFERYDYKVPDFTAGGRRAW